MELKKEVNVKNHDPKKLRVIRMIHTLIWLFFNVVIFYLAYAVIASEIDPWFWAGLSLFALEGIILLLFKMSCPLTIWARQYSDSTHDNFDIFLPEWLARNNKRIYGVFLGLIIIILMYRLITHR